MIQAVTFDLWDTLVLNSQEREMKAQKIREELLHNALNGKVSKKVLARALDQSWSQIQSVRETLKDVPTSEQLRILKKILNVECDLEKPYTEAILYAPPCINPYAKQILTQLETKKGLISNTGRTPGKVLRSLLSEMDILKFFDIAVFSNEVGFLKPHPEIFKQAAQKLGIPLSNILHVGDDRTTDVEGAHRTGMHTLLVEEPADLLKVVELVQ